MKTSLPLCMLVLIGVGLTMVRASCDQTASNECSSTFIQGAATAQNNKDAFCRLYNTYTSCVQKACPGTTSAMQSVTDILKQAGFDCSHASHLVSAQTMPVLLLFIIGLFFGVF